MTNLAQYKHSIGKVIKPNQMKYTPQINEQDVNAVFETMKQMFAFYLPSVGKEITFDKTGTSVLINRIILDFGFLEMQEIEYILSCGIVGKYGAIFGSISLDVIYPWFSKYCETDRKERPEPNQKETEPTFTGNEMTSQEFYLKYPELEERNKIYDILFIAKAGKLTLLDVKKFYSIKGFTNDDVKEDMVIYSKKYFALDEETRNHISESLFILNEFSKFVIENWNKTK